MSPNWEVRESMSPRDRRLAWIGDLILAICGVIFFLWIF